ncbi:MAG: acyl-CoA thioesterase domain-containing protein [Actinomycetota bacterium]
MTDGALFERFGDVFRPSPFTTGPWRADAMHGGPPSALIGSQVLTAVGEDEYVARLNVEIERPVPLHDLRVDVVRRDVSRRVAHVDAVLVDAESGDRLSSARALVLRRAPLPEPAWSAVEVAASPDDAAHVQMASWASGDVPTTYHQHAVEHRPVSPTTWGEGPMSCWVRLRVPLIDGEATPPLSRILAAADFGSGISSIFDVASGVGLINADLSVALRRDPVGEWVRVDAETNLEPDGSALCAAVLFDERGRLGASTQALLGLTI